MEGTCFVHDFGYLSLIHSIYAYHSHYITQCIETIRQVHVAGNAKSLALVCVGPNMSFWDAYCIEYVADGKSSVGLKEASVMIRPVDADHTYLHEQVVFVFNLVYIKVCGGSCIALHSALHNTLRLYCICNRTVNISNSIVHLPTEVDHYHVRNLPHLPRTIKR